MAAREPTARPRPPRRKKRPSWWRSWLLGRWPPATAVTLGEPGRLARVPDEPSVYARSIALSSSASRAPFGAPEAGLVASPWASLDGSPGCLTSATIGLVTAQRSASPWCRKPV